MASTASPSSTYVSRFTPSRNALLRASACNLAQCSWRLRSVFAQDQNPQRRVGRVRGKIFQNGNGFEFGAECSGKVNGPGQCTPTLDHVDEIVEDPST